MTGTQESLTSGERLLEILRGLGVKDDHLHVVDPVPQKHKENVELFKKEIEHPGLSVIVPTRACLHALRKVGKPGKEAAPASA
jgi:indolepyruvate ferredoxin oxidoreductase alpha subunit